MYSKQLLCRDYLGCVDVSRESIENIINEHTKGSLCVIAPGGTSEMFDAHPGHYRINLSRRKGFVRMALQQGYAALLHLLSIRTFQSVAFQIKTSFQTVTVIAKLQTYLLLWIRGRR